MMNINVSVDTEEDLEWLKYTLDTFVLVSGANFKLSICNRSELPQGLVIGYGLSFALNNNRVISIPRVNDYQPGDYKNIVADNLHDSRIQDALIPIFRKTFASDYAASGKSLLNNKEDDSCCATLTNNCIKLSFDLFFNSFVHLSCLEELEYERRHGPTHSYASKLNVTDAVYEKPIVNYLFAILEDMLLLLVEEPYKDKLFRKQEGFQLCLTHDVDYIRKTLTLRAKRSVFHLSNGFRDLKKAKIMTALNDLNRSFYFLVKPCDYWQFEYIQELEEAHNFRSTFYFYAGVKRRKVIERLRRLVFDPWYDIYSDGLLKNKMIHLVEKGWEVGLHGSFDSYHSQNLLLEEKNKLEAITGLPVMSTRQHWLNLSIIDTWKIQSDTGIRADTTLGFNDFIGFRAGIACPYYPYDFNYKKRHRILEVPMVLMDGTLFDHCRMDNAEARKKSFDILEEVKQFNGCVAINWHQRTPASDYNWYWLYQEILSWIVENGGKGMPVSACVGDFQTDADLL